MTPRVERLVREARGRSPRLALVSLYDVENNAVRLLAAELRRAGHDCVEVYFKDWVSNHLLAPTDRELELFAQLLRDQQVDLVCLSLRASAYFQVARVLDQAAHELADLPVLWGGMHPTLRPHECLQHADLVIKGEGELALLDLVSRLRDGGSLLDCPNLFLRHADGSVTANEPRPLITDLDTLAFRDYAAHDRKFFIWADRLRRGDPMHGDPVYQAMGSRGCIYKCSFCYNSTYKKDIYPDQKWYRVRSPESLVEEIVQAREHWPMKRVRFDDEVFFFQKRWLEDFCRLYKERVGLPFDIFVEPKLVTEERMVLLRDAGLVAVNMGVQATERVTGHLYDRRVKNQTVADIAVLLNRLGIRPHFQLIFDDPATNEEDLALLFDLVADFPHPFDLYLFSMTVFPGSELNHKLLESGQITEYDVEGLNTRIFYQHRVNLRYPRPVEETFWIALIQMLSKPFVPRALLRGLARSATLKQHPLPVIQLANAVNFAKMGGQVAKMATEGEMSGILWRRWANLDTIITT